MAGLGLVYVMLVVEGFWGMPIQILPAIMRHGLAENPGNVERDATDK